MALTFGEFMRQVLRKHNMTQLELSRRSGIAQEQVSRYARGSQPTVDSFKRLCKGMPELRDYLDEEAPAAS